MEARIGYGTGEDLCNRLNISALAVVEQVIQCNHCWVTEFDREKVMPFENDARCYIQNISTLENSVFLPC
jgi:hypothetical protein